MPFSGFNELDPRLRDPLQQFLAARPGISPFSGYRSPQHQQELFDAAVQKYGSVAAARRWVAPPGHSQHNFGMATDLRFASPEDRAWAHAHAGDYGLTFPMSWEPWHVEPIGARSSPGTPGIDQSSQPTGNVPPTPAAPGLSMFTAQGERNPASGYFDVPLAQQPPMTPERFLMGMIAGENPLRSMVFNRIGSILGLV